MWLIKNSTNKPILDEYVKIISSIFKVIIEVSKSESLDDDFILENFFDLNKNLDKKLLKVKRNKHENLKQQLKKSIELGESKLKEEFEIYQQQNNELNNFNFNLEQKNHPESLTVIFKDYFYDKFFSESWIWSKLLGIEFNRSVFKKNYLDENKLFVCSYCDVDTIASLRNSWIEHFLPKNKFPYVSCNLNNLIPSCTACNVSGTGKGTEVLKPIVNQNTTQIGDEIIFDLKEGHIIIDKCQNESVENYVSLLKLRKRYKEDAVNQKIISTLENNYGVFNSAYKQGEFDLDSFLEYIKEQGRNSGSYFVQKGLFEYIDTIKS